MKNIPELDAASEFMKCRALSKRLSTDNKYFTHPQAISFDKRPALPFPSSLLSPESSERSWSTSLLKLITVATVKLHFPKSESLFTEEYLHRLIRYAVAAWIKG